MSDTLNMGGTNAGKLATLARLIAQREERRFLTPPPCALFAPPQYQRTKSGVFLPETQTPAPPLRVDPMTQRSNYGLSVKDLDGLVGIVRKATDNPAKILTRGLIETLAEIRTREAIAAMDPARGTHD